MLSKKSLSAIWLVLVRGRMIVCELDVTFCLSSYCWLWMRADAFPTLSLALANFEWAHRLRGTRNIGSFSTIS